jgi:5-methylcytosine-specific restriction protein A
VTAAVVPDHIVPLRVDPSRQYDETNLQSLCVEHHQEKTQEDIRNYPDFYNRDGRRG